MKKYLVHSVVALTVILLPLTTRAEESTNAHHLSNVQVLYIETQPSAEEIGTPRGKVRELLKKFEQRSEEEKVAETLALGDFGYQKAEKIAFDNGYLDMPYPMYDALISGLSKYHVLSNPTFFSLVRSKDQAEKIKNELAKKYPPQYEKADYTLTLMPYRISLQGANDVVVWFGVLLFDGKTNQGFWTHYISIPFGSGRKGFNEADGNRIASLLIDEFLKKGWIKAE